MNENGRFCNNISVIIVILELLNAKRSLPILSSNPIFFFLHSCGQVTAYIHIERVINQV